MSVRVVMNKERLVPVRELEALVEKWRELANSAELDKHVPDLNFCAARLEALYLVEIKGWGRCYRDQEAEARAGLERPAATVHIRPGRKTAVPWGPETIAEARADSQPPCPTCKGTGRLPLQVETQEFIIFCPDCPKGRALAERTPDPDVDGQRREAEEHDA